MSCPTENQIAEYLEGLLTSSDRERVDQHLDACQGCFALVSASLEERARLAIEPSVEASLRSQSGRGATVLSWSATAVMDTARREEEGRYTVLGDQGHGGQAWVFTVFDEHMRREVALKSLLPRQAEEESLTKSERSQRLEFERRFLQEARIVAQLSHPSIIHVYEVGRRKDGALYYTMPLVRGRTLAAVLRVTQSLSERLGCLRHFADMCNGIAYAHSRGVLHRDIKPANVMIGEFGETLILDWGLGTWMGSSDPLEDSEGEPPERPDRTATGVLLGTPSYMSPEQARGLPGEIDARSDIWSLGAVLYEILTGRPPHRSRTASRLLEKARSLPVRPVAERCAGVPPDLSAVAEKALAFDPRNRYASARELADDVTAFMTGNRVSAYGYSRRERLLRFVSAHKAAVAALGATGAMLLLVIVLMDSSYRRERAAHQHEARARAQEAKAGLLAQFHLAEAYATKARHHLEEGDPLAAGVFAAGSLNSNPAHPLAPNHQPGFAQEHPESRYLAAQALADLMRSDARVIRGLVGVLEAGAPLHRLAVLGSGSGLVASGSNHGLWLWEWPSRRMIVPERADQESYAFLAGSAGPHFAVASGNRLWLRDTRTGAVVRELARMPDPFAAVALTDDGSVLASGGRDHVLRTWNSSTGQLLTEQDVGRDIKSLAFGNHGAVLALGTQDGRVLLRRAHEALAILSPGHSEGVTSLAFSSDGRWLASGSHDRSVRLWDLNKGASKGASSRVLGLHRDMVNAVAFSPDGRWVTSSGRDGVLHIWDVVEGTLVESMGAGHPAQEDVRFLPGGVLAMCGFDGHVRLWGLDGSRAPASLTGHTGHVNAVQFSGDGTRVVSGGMDATVRVWDPRSRTLIRTLTGHTNAVQGVAITPDLRTAVSVSRDRSVRVWDIDSGTQTAQLADVRSSVYAMALAPDGSRVAVSGDDGVIRVALVNGLGGLRQWKVHAGYVFGVAWSPDGKLIASGGQDGRVCLSDSDAGTVVQKNHDHSDWTGGLTFSPDGTLLASVGKDAKVVIRDTRTGRLVQELHDHTEWVNDVAFSDDGRLLATASDDGVVIVRETGQWHPVLQMSTQGMALSVAFSPGGRVLAVASRDAIELWSLDWTRWEKSPTDLLREAEEATGAVLRGFRLAPINTL